MIGRSFASADFDAMVFERCTSIHTMFMSEAIDAVFIDLENRVSRVCSNLSPWHPVVFGHGGRSVIELPAGAVERLNIEIGDVLDLNAEVVPEVVLSRTNKVKIPGPDTKPAMPCKES